MEEYAIRLKSFKNVFGFHPWKLWNRRKEQRKVDEFLRQLARKILEANKVLEDLEGRVEEKVLELAKEAAKKALEKFDKAHNLAVNFGYEIFPSWESYIR